MDAQDERGQMGGDTQAEKSVCVSVSSVHLIWLCVCCGHTLWHCNDYLIIGTRQVFLIGSEQRPYQMTAADGE